jgi:DNA mismatch repair protein MutL
MHGEYPYVVLWVDVPSDEVDVNIHPTKSEVKFVNSSDVYRSVNKAVRLELEKSPWLGHEGVKVVKHNQLMKSNSKLKPQENLNFQNSEFDKTQYQQKTPLMVSKTNLQSYSLKSPVSSYKGESNSDARDENKYQMNELDAFLNTEKVTKSSPNKKLLNNDKDWKASFINESNSIEFVKNNTFQQTETLENTHNVKESFSCEIKNYWKNMQVLTQLNQTYIVCQNSDKFILIDQHAAHERVMFEKLNKSWELKKFECQNYLIPLTFETSEEEALVINENKDMLLKMGFGVDLLSEKEVAINWAPSFINEKTVKIIIFQLAKEIMQASGSFAIENNINHIFATMACHSAIRAGQALSLEEMQSLLKQMDEFSFSSYCPHGRPVSIDFTWYEIEKLFGRIV